MGPVVNEKAMKSILDYIEVGKKEGRLIHGGGPAKDAGDGYFIQPTVIADIRTDGAHFPGRNFWAGAGGDQGAQF